jgi:hypothetical protein
MTIFAAVAILFILFAWTRSLNRFRVGYMSGREFFFWTVIWFSAAMVVMIPNLSDTIARRIGIGRGADVVVYASIIVILYLLFRLYAYIATIEREITRLVRALALSEEKEKRN